MHNYKHIFAAGILSSTLIACSGEAKKSAPIAPESEQAVVNDAAAKDPVNIEIKPVTRQDTRAAAEAEAKAITEALDKAAEDKAAEDKAAEDKAAEDKAAEDRAAQDAADLDAAQARAAQIAAQKKAAESARAEFDAKERLAAQERQAAIDAQYAKDAQIRQEAEAERLAQDAKDARALETVVTAPPKAPAAVISPNTPYNNFLAKYVSNVNGINLIAYDKVTSQDRAALKSYIATLSAMDIEALPRDAEMATWFNLYNAKTIELILENYPTKSIRKISNPWKKDRLVVNGKKMSLDDIEHNTVRRKYKEPRVHYAFNCASIGCPNVKLTAWEAASLEADLTQAARDFIASDRGVEIKDNKIIISSIFKWYKKDFGGNEDGILSHLRQYASGSKKSALDAANNINKYDYDWDLNIKS